MAFISQKNAIGYVVTYVTAAWVRSHLKYFDAGPGVSHEGVDPNGHRVVFEKRGYWINTVEMLRCTEFQGACRHSAVLVRDLLQVSSDELGIKPHYVGGWPRLVGVGKQLKDCPCSHAWNMVELANGMQIEFDATGTSNSLEQWRKDHARFFPSADPVFVIPRTPAQLEVFYAHRYGGTLDLWFGKTDTDGVSKRLRPLDVKQQDSFMHMTIEQWLAVDTTSIPKLEQWVRSQSGVNP